MTATSHPKEPFDPKEAARILRETERYDDGLRRRTEGLTFALWGLAAAGIFVSYTALHAAGGPAWLDPVLWMAWVLPGGLLTGALWRSAQLSATSRGVGSPRDGLIIGATWIGLFLAALLALAVLRPAVQPPVLFLGVAGAVALVVGATNRPRFMPAGRRVLLGTGLLQIAGAAALLSAALPVAASGAAAAVITGVVWIGGGLWETLGG